MPSNAWSEQELSEYMRRYQSETSKGGDASYPETSRDPESSRASSKAPGKSTPGAHAPTMNKTEQEYGQYLSILKLAGEITYWDFEKIKVRIGYHCWFNPDFFVQFPDGHFELHDTKGAKKRAGIRGGRTYLAEDDAIVKARALGSGQFPIPIYFVHKGAHGEWNKILM